MLTHATGRPICAATCLTNPCVAPYSSVAATKPAQLSPAAASSAACSAAMPEPKAAAPAPPSSAFSAASKASWVGAALRE